MSFLTTLNNSRPDFTLYPFWWLVIAFATGIFVSQFLGFDWKFYLLPVILGGILTVWSRRNKSGTVLVLISFVFLGGFYFQIQRQNEPENSIKRIYDTGRIFSGDPVEIEGFLDEPPEVSGGGFFLVLRCEKIIYKNHLLKTTGNIRLFAPVGEEAEIQKEYDSLDLKNGMPVRVAVNLLREERFLNPGSASRLEFLEQKGIEATGVIKSPLLIEIISFPDSHPLMAGIVDYRQKLIRIFRETFSPSTAGILIASLLGNREFLTRETASVFREGGIFHILVISGLHITFIGGVLLLIIRRVTRRKFWHFFLTCSGLWIYALGVGGEIPVIRAALMFTILLFPLVIYRRGTLLNSLGLSAFIILLWRPADLFNQSFQLTLGSLTAIITVAFPLIENLRRVGNWMPSAATPFPPNASRPLKIFCETLYWSERLWEKTRRENIWDCRLFKSNPGTRLEKYRLQNFFGRIFEGILITLAVQIFLLPFMAVYFHRLSPGSFLLNLWVGFFIVLQNVTALIAVLFAEFSDALAFPLVHLTEIFNFLLLIVPEMLAETGQSSVRLPVYPGAMKAVYVLYYLPLFILAGLINNWNPFRIDRERPVPGLKSKILAGVQRICPIVLSFFIILIVFHPRSSPEPDGKLKIDFLDVGQGDSALVTFPNGETLLIDGGGSINFNRLNKRQADGREEPFEPDTSRIGERVVSEFLWEKGFSEIGYLLATHADADHLQGLIDVAKNFRIKGVLIGRGNTAEEDDGLDEFLEVLQKKKIPVIKLAGGDFFEIGGVRADVLNPEPEENQKKSSVNNDSVVIRLSFGSRRFLLTGDIEKETEREMLRNPGFLRADVIKVAHHGSRTSSTKEFVRAVKADFAIVSVGRKSRFGHPHREVVERWQKSGARVLKTGDRGTITVSTNGKNLEVQTFKK